MSAPIKLVFFGLDSGFSRSVLKTICSAGYKPELFVLGTPSRIRTFRNVPAESSFLERWLRKDAPNETLRLVRELGIRAVEVSHADDPKLWLTISALSPDVLFIAGFHKLLPRSILDLAKLAGLNLHPGKLPEERGPAPLFWALKAGRTHHAYSIHLLDEGEDSGDVVAAGAYDVTPGMHGDEILERCAIAAAPSVMRVLRDLVRGELLRTRQNPDKAARCRRPFHDDGRIDVARRASEIYTFVKGCRGRYLMFAECAGDRFYVSDAISHDDEAKLGFDFVVSGDLLFLKTAQGVVQLLIAPGGAQFSAEYVE